MTASAPLLPLRLATTFQNTLWDASSYCFKFSPFQSPYATVSKPCYMEHDIIPRSSPFFLPSLCCVPCVNTEIVSPSGQGPVLLFSVKIHKQESYDTHNVSVPPKCKTKLGLTFTAWSTTFAFWTIILQCTRYSRMHCRYNANFFTPAGEKNTQREKWYQWQINACFAVAFLSNIWRCWGWNLSRAVATCLLLRGRGCGNSPRRADWGHTAGNANTSPSPLWPLWAPLSKTPHPRGPRYILWPTPSTRQNSSNLQKGKGGRKRRITSLMRERERLNPQSAKRNFWDKLDWSVIQVLEGVVFGGEGKPAKNTRDFELSKKTAFPFIQKRGK